MMPGSDRKAADGRVIIRRLDLPLVFKGKERLDTLVQSMCADWKANGG